MIKFIYVNKQYCKELYNEELNERWISNVPILDNPNYKYAKCFLACEIKFNNKKYVVIRRGQKKYAMLQF